MMVRGRALLFALCNTMIFAQQQFYTVACAGGDSSASSDASREITREEALSLPGNVASTDFFRPVLRQVFARSATFRRQCRLIERASIKVEVMLVLPEKVAPYRALSKVRKHRNGHMTVQVEIALLSDYVELIGHEFEHVVEQIEGVDLLALSRLAGGGVRKLDGGVFETDRAQQVGQVVAGEFRIAARRSEKRKEPQVNANERR